MAVFSLCLALISVVEIVTTRVPHLARRLRPDFGLKQGDIIGLEDFQRTEDIPSPTLKCCVPWSDGGGPFKSQVGNSLSEYWSSRGQAYFSGQTFLRPEVHPRDRNETWLNFLPVKVMAKAAQNTKVKPNTCRHECVGSWTDPEMISIIREEAGPAMKVFLAQKGLEIPKFVQGDVVIHIRCGDIITSSNPEYGLLPFRWFKQNMPPSTKRVYLVGNFHHSRKIDAPSDDRCDRIKKAYTDFFEDGMKLQVTFMGKSADEDFAALMFAPAMMASVSTFSLWAGISSRANTIIFPRSHLFFGCSTPSIENVKWVNVSMLSSMDIVGMNLTLDDVEEVLRSDYQHLKDVIKHYPSIFVHCEKAMESKAPAWEK